MTQSTTEWAVPGGWTASDLTGAGLVQGRGTTIIVLGIAGDESIIAWERGRALMMLG